MSTATTRVPTWGWWRPSPTWGPLWTCALWTWSGRAKARYTKAHRSNVIVGPEETSLTKEHSGYVHENSVSDRTTEEITSASSFFPSYKCQYWMNPSFIASWWCYLMKACACTIIVCTDIVNHTSILYYVHAPNASWDHPFTRPFTFSFLGRAAIDFQKWPWPFVV